MTGEDSELERLKARRLAEMQRNMAHKKPQTEQDDPRDIVMSKLGHRGDEVLRNAEAQFPSQTRMVVTKLAQMIMAGEIPHSIDGGRLLELFRAIGIMVRMDTKIQIVKDGQTSSISDRLKSIKDEGEGPSS